MSISQNKNILEKIVDTKAAHIAKLKLTYPEASLQPKISDRSLYDALNGPDAAYILECKKASPSKGLIREDFNLAHIADTYRDYAAGISVLTDEQFFQGSFDYIPTVRERVHQPILCKDFFVHPYQVKLAAHQGADAILLMLSVLDDRQYRLLAAEATRYKLDILTEVSNKAETERAIALNAKIIGINNRNLRDLSTNLATTEALAPLIPSDTVVISESGIYTQQQVSRLNPLVKGYLVGSSLMAEQDLDLACRALIYGENKVCGLTQLDNMNQAADAGAVYGGLIFFAKSKRSVTLEQAQALVDQHRQTQDKRIGKQLKFVGVFVNEAIEIIVDTAKTLSLSAIQLHGQETQQDIIALRQALNAEGLTACQIWKAIAIAADTELTHIAIDIPEQVDRIIYDSKVAGQFGGTGEQFDWQLALPSKSKAMLAGGLSADNAHLAKQQSFLGLDLNSGLETAPGIKSPELIAKAFSEIRRN